MSIMSPESNSLQDTQHNDAKFSLNNTQNQNTECDTMHVIVMSIVVSEYNSLQVTQHNDARL
jgi:hypothetical protein